MYNKVIEKEKLNTIVEQELKLMNEKYNLLMHK